MGFDQYHEPADELPPATRTFARLCASLTEEAEAIGWYEQRLALETDSQAQAIMRDAQGEEFKHFSMDLEFLLRRCRRGVRSRRAFFSRRATSSSTVRRRRRRRSRTGMAVAIARRMTARSESAASAEARYEPSPALAGTGQRLKLGPA